MPTNSSPKRSHATVAWEQRPQRTTYRATGCRPAIRLGALFPRRIGRLKSSRNKRTDPRDAASVPEPSTTAKITEKDYRDRRMNADQRPRWAEKQGPAYRVRRRAGYQLSRSDGCPPFLLRQPYHQDHTFPSRALPRSPLHVPNFPPPGPGFDSHLRTASELPEC